MARINLSSPTLVMANGTRSSSFGSYCGSRSQHSNLATTTSFKVVCWSYFGPSRIYVVPFDLHVDKCVPPASGSIAWI